MNYVVSIEGQTIPVPEEIGANDEAVKRALSPFYPEAANALVTRVVKDETTTITVVKKAGSKGLSELENGFHGLRECVGGMNPAVVMYDEIQVLEDREAFEPGELLELDARLGTAIEEGENQAAAVLYAYGRLGRSVPQAGPVVVIGF